MPRPIFTNETLGIYNEPLTGFSSNKPHYKLIFDTEEIVPFGVNLVLQNPITGQGTPQNADTMNNLFVFDNLHSMRDNTRETIFNPDGSVLEQIKNTATGVVNATRLTTFPGATIVEEIIVYNDSGTLVLRRSKTTTSFEANGTIKEVVEL